MWNQWRRKIYDFFIIETIEIEEIPNEINERDQQPLKTKMMYQYPTVKPFRFPIIPDQTDQKETLETPAYQRRGKNPPRRERMDNVQQNQHAEGKNNIETNRNKQPFRPSQVASPIYGYHERKREKEIKNIPTFIRKKQSEEIQKEKKTLDHEDNESHVQNNEPPIEYKQQSTSKNNVNQIETITTKRNHSNRLNKSQIEKEEQQDRPKVVERKKRSNRIHNRDSNEQNPNSKQKTRQIPYNVMMTPKDKRNLIHNNQAKTEKGTKTNHVHRKKHGIFPPYHLLNDPEKKSSQDQLWVQNQQQLLEKTLMHFNVNAKVVNATQGPSVTRFEVQPEMGVKVSRVRNLNDDIKLNMAAKDIRIEAPIPGKNTIGIEVPNLNSQMVGLQEIFTANTFKQSTSPLTIGLGLTIGGDPLITNISKMPHGLIAGATGSGKSVCINTILISLLYKSNYEDVKFSLIDPKMVELAPYNDIPHLVAPVITDVKAATASLKWAVSEMEGRYEKFVKEGVRDIERYNSKIMKQNRSDEKMPFIVIVIDELADLMMVSPQDVEDAICRIAQKARACGIHLLLATQRPSVDVITGLIKANIPTRIAFSVSSQVDSRTIIDTNGAEKLLGKGDMLFVENGSRKSIRLQGAFVSDEEIERVTNYARSMAPPNYLFEQEELIKQTAIEEDEDDLLEDVIAFIFEQNSASTSLLQRHFRIGYNRAARLIDTLETKGLISEQNGSKPRDVLLSQTQYEDILQSQ